MPKFITLLDVDDCVAVSNKHFDKHDGGYCYNDPLLEALLQSQLTEIYLITSYTLSGIAKNLKDEYIAAPSRLKLIQYLEKKGFKVRAVLTLLDVVYHRGVGAYYEEVIKPFEAQVLQGANFSVDKLNNKSAEGFSLQVENTTNAAAFATENKAYQEACVRERELRKLGDEQGITNKGSLYENLVLTQDKVLGATIAYVMIDDRMNYLDEVRAKNQAVCHRPLLLLQAEPHRNAQSYLTEILPFLTMTREMLQCQENMNRDEQYEKLKTEILKLTEPKGKSAGQALVLGLEEPCYVPLNVARKMLSQDAEGRDVDPHSLGHSLVVSLGDIFFKRPLERPLIETCVYELSRKLGGGLVTPIRLLFVQVPEGLVAVQASLKVGELGLDQVLRLPGGIRGLKKVLGEGRLIENLSNLLSGEYYQSWLLKQGLERERLENLSREKEVELLLQACYRLPEAQWPKELRDLRRDKVACEKIFQKAREQNRAQDPNLKQDNRKQSQVGLLDNVASQETALREAELRTAALFEEDKRALLACKGLRGKALLPLAALLTLFPELGEGTYLLDLIHLPEIFVILKQLFPKEMDRKGGIENILLLGEQILNHFDRQNICGHIILALLTEPEDHKGDNFRVRIRHQAGELLPLQVVAIDNDSAMQGVLKCFGNESVQIQHIPIVKTIFYCVPEWLSLCFDKQSGEWFNSFNPERLVAEWFEAILAYSLHYQKLLQGVRSARSPLKGQLSLLEELGLQQLPQGFVERLQLRLQILKSFEMAQSPTLGELLLKINPILAQYYQAVNKRYGDPQATLMAIYDRQNCPTVEAQLGKSIEALQKEFGIEQNLLAAVRREQYLALGLEATKFIKRQFNLLLDPEPKLCSLDSNIQPTLLPILFLLKRFGAEKFLIPELSIESGILIQLYQKYGLDVLVFLKENCRKVVLKLGESQEEQVLLNDPLLMVRLILLKKASLPLVEMLLAYGVDATLRIDEGNIMHVAARHNCYSMILAVFKFKETLGNRLLKVLDNQQRSPVDLAFELRQEETMRVLLQLGAGQYLNIKNGFAFIEKYRGLEPELCNQLLSLHSELAVKMAIFAITQEKASAEEVCIEGLEDLRYLKSEVYKKIFKDQDEFPHDNPYGRHNVTSIDCPISHRVKVGFHLKENAKLPGREMMVHLLAKRLFGYITPPVMLWKFSKLVGIWRKYSVAYPVLASRTVVGRNLHQVFRETPDIVAKIDPLSLCQAAILAMLCGTEDGRADNYIVEEFYRGSELCYRLVSIDHEHSFVKPIKRHPNGEEVEGPLGLQMKSILFCMDFMNAPLHPEVREQLQSLNPFYFLKDWLDDLISQQKKIDTLFNDKKREALLKQGIYLNVVFKPSIVADLYQRCIRLKQVLNRHPRITLLGLLSRVIPELGLRYSQAFTQFNNPVDRFQHLTEGWFETRKLKVNANASAPKHHSNVPTNTRSSLDYQLSKVTASDVIQMTVDKKLEADLYAKEKKENAEVALERLQEIEANYQKLKSIQQELQAGETQNFLRLIHEQELILDQQDIVLNGRGMEFPGIDFGLMLTRDGKPNIERQVRVLNALQGIQFRRLRLRNCEALTDDGLSKLLRPLKNLRALELRGCGNLSNRALISLSLYCPALEKLMIQGMPSLEVVSGITFPKLRVLSIQDCGNLKEWLANTPLLQRLHFSNCMTLQKINKSLRKLRIFTAIRCERLAHSAFYQKYPQLMRPPLEDRNTAFVEGFVLELEGLLLKAGIDTEGGLPAVACDWWQEASRVWEVCFKEVSEQDLIKIVSPLLKDGDWYVRRAAAEALGNLSISREKVGPVFDVLLPLLKDIEWSVRSAAASALGNLSISREKVGPVFDALLPLLKDGDEFVRSAAASALGNLSISREKVRPVVDVLLPLLEDRYECVIRAVAEALGKLPLSEERLGEAVDALLPLLDDIAGLRGAAAEALGTLPLSERLGQAVHALLPLLKDRDKYVRKTAAEALSKLPVSRERLGPVFEALLPRLQDGDGFERRDAAEALGNLGILGERLGPVFEALLPLLKDGAGYVRTAAAKALGSLSISGERAGPVVDVLLPLLKDGDKYVRGAAVEALGKLPLSGERAAQVFEELLPLLKYEDKYVRRAAVEALGKLPLSGERARPVVDVLLPLLKDGDKYVRGAAVEALGKLPLSGERAAQVFEALLPLLKDEDGDVRRAAVQVFLKYPPALEFLSLTVKTILPLLDHNDKEIRLEAITVLSSFLSPNYLLANFNYWLKQNYLKKEGLVEKATVRPTISNANAMALPPMRARIEALQPQFETKQQDEQAQIHLFSKEANAVNGVNVASGTHAANATNGSSTANSVNTSNAMDPNPIRTQTPDTTTLKTLFKHVKAGEIKEAHELLKSLHEAAPTLTANMITNPANTQETIIDAALQIQNLERRKEMMAILKEIFNLGSIKSQSRLKVQVT